MEVMGLDLQDGAVARSVDDRGRLFHGRKRAAETMWQRLWSAGKTVSTPATAGDENLGGEGQPAGLCRR